MTSARRELEEANALSEVLTEAASAKDVAAHAREAAVRASAHAEATKEASEALATARAKAEEAARKAGAERVQIETVRGFAPDGLEEKTKVTNEGELT